jgi:hypothetical protein
MLLHKVLLRLVVPRVKRDDPGARLTFLLAATSKALASTVTYPFSLAKTRAQVSSQKPSSTAGETSEINSKKAQSRTGKIRERTVFSTIMRIAQTEGLAGLYCGLGAEVLKGFFSHGITMLMKERIHTLILSLYYTIAQSLQKLPSPEELAKRATGGAKDVFEQGKEQASGAYTRSVEIAGQASERVKEAVADGSQRAAGFVESGKQQASDAYARGSQLSDSASTRLQDAAASGSQKAGELYTAAGNASNTASEKAKQFVQGSKSTASNATQQTSELLAKGTGLASRATERASGAAETGRDAVGNIGQRVGEAVKEADINDINGTDTGIKD